jgi:4-aminobutyrate aminotransferase-like enzyme
LHGGVPMLWMIRWAGSFPVFVKEAKGARFTDVDGNSYIDFCLGDTGAMTGHAPEATVKAITEQIQKGITLMLPYEDVIWVGEELQRRFKLPYWQFALTATDANRFALRMARLITGNARKFLSSIIAITARWMKPSSRSMKKARRSRAPTTWVRKLTRARPPRSSSSTTSPRSNSASPRAMLRLSSPNLP